MKERPILFSAPMVRAILEGGKNQTRRVIKHQDSFNKNYPYRAGDDLNHKGKPYRCPYGNPGNRLWVREAWRAARWYDDLSPSDLPYQTIIEYGTNTPTPDAGRLRPSIHMPRWASRITLEVVSVRVERLQDISEEDARAEGVAPNWCGDLATGRNSDGGQGWTGQEGWEKYGADVDEFPAFTARESFESLWESINGPGSWAQNPWVWVVEFKRV